MRGKGRVRYKLHADAGCEATAERSGCVLRFCIGQGLRWTAGKCKWKCGVLGGGCDAEAAAAVFSTIISGIATTITAATSVTVTSSGGGVGQQQQQQAAAASKQQQASKKQQLLPCAMTTCSPPLALPSRVTSLHHAHVHCFGCVF